MCYSKICTFDELSKVLYKKKVIKLKKALMLVKIVSVFMLLLIPSLIFFLLKDLVVFMGEVKEDLLFYIYKKIGKE